MRKINLTSAQIVVKDICVGGKDYLVFSVIMRNYGAERLFSLVMITLTHIATGYSKATRNLQKIHSFLNNVWML